MAISDCIKDDVRKELYQSCAYGIMIDEATDIATVSSLIIYAYLISEGVRKVRYLADIQLGQCDANAIVAAISKVLKEDYGVEINKCFGFGSSVMTGRENGVAAILKRESPYLTAIHCAAHRLALASSQAATGIPVIVQYRRTLSAIYSHFSHSTVHTQELLAVQRVLDEPEIKMKKLYDIRWLSFHNVVDTIRRSLTSLFVYFENAAEEGDPIAKGIHNSITTYLFLALTHLLDDVLSILAKLSLNFQRQNLDISLVQPKVCAVIDAINRMKVHDGPKLGEFQKAYDDGAYVLYNIKDSASQQTSFSNARRDFLTKLKQELARSLCE